MNKIEELKAAVGELEIAVVELQNAESALDSWDNHDMRREDGSTAQDARHEEIGRRARERVNEARQIINSKKELVAALTVAV